MAATLNPIHDILLPPAPTKHDWHGEAICKIRYSRRNGPMAVAAFAMLIAFMAMVIEMLGMVIANIPIFIASRQIFVAKFATAIAMPEMIVVIFPMTISRFGIFIRNFAMAIAKVFMGIGNGDTGKTPHGASLWYGGRTLPLNYLATPLWLRPTGRGHNHFYNHLIL